MFEESVKNLLKKEGKSTAKINMFMDDLEIEIQRICNIDGEVEKVLRRTINGAK